MNIGPRIVVMTSLLLTLCGCTGQRDFLMVQLCLSNKQNLMDFKSIMKSISQSQLMNYYDDSAENQKELTNLRGMPKYEIISIGASRKNGVGWDATNLGLSSYEVVLGFTEGSDPAEAHRFADMVVGELSKRWHVYVVPPGHGASSMKVCRGPTSVVASGQSG